MYFLRPTGGDRKRDRFAEGMDRKGCIREPVPLSVPRFRFQRHVPARSMPRPVTYTGVVLKEIEECGRPKVTGSIRDLAGGAGPGIRE